MEKFLVLPLFKYAILPIGTAILGILLKYISRNDQFAKFRKEDLAVGLDLALTACLMFVVLTTERAINLIKTNDALSNCLKKQPINPIIANNLQVQAQKLSSQFATSGWLIVLMFIGLFGLSTIVRKWGWQSAVEMKPIIGITIPLTIGITYIIFVMIAATP